jgi:hypothetical protein
MCAAQPVRMDSAPSIDRRLIDKLIREITCAELQAGEHAPREARRLGEAPPVIALREVAAHANVMRSRFIEVLAAHDLRLGRQGLGAALATLRNVVVEAVPSVIDPERSFRMALLELRHCVEIVKLLRDAARRELLFGVIRWCDDWLGARRTLVARVEAQLAWFVEHEQAGYEVPQVEAVEATSQTGELDDWHADRTT